MLVEAIRQVPDLHQRIAVRMVGGAFENESKEVALRTLVRDNGLADIVAVLPFSADPDEHLRWADVVVVPSRRARKRSGGVAIEAMAYWPPADRLGRSAGSRRSSSTTTRGGSCRRSGPRPWQRACRRSSEAPASLADKVEPARRRYEALFSEGAAAAAISSVVATADRALQAPQGPARPPTPMLLDRA